MRFVEEEGAAEDLGDLGVGCGAELGGGVVAGEGGGFADLHLDQFVGLAWATRESVRPSWPTWRTGAR